MLSDMSLLSSAVQAADDSDAAVPSSVVRERKVDGLSRSYATGKRKTSISRVWVKRGIGKVLVNGKDCVDYFHRSVLQALVFQPLLITRYDNQLDVYATVRGGGLSGQAGAVCYGLSKALVLFDPNVHKVLRTEGLLTRDSRVVERKKYGRRKARKAFQFSKR